MPQIGKVLIISGIVMLTVGVFLVFFSDKIKWFGNLPLDFSYKSDSTRFYAPIGSMILLSYAIHKVDPVFIVGQSCGFLIYSRNIYLIKKEGKNKKNDPSKIMKMN